jgi:hypothetical protein
MPGKNKTPLLGWHPKSAEHLAWLEAEVERRGGERGVKSELLDEALALLHAKLAVTTEVTTPPPAKPAVRKPRKAANAPVAAKIPQPKPCTHPGVGRKQLCPKCRRYNVL